MKNWKNVLDPASFKKVSLDRLIRLFLFPLSAVFAISALVIAVSTYSDLENSSISSAFATVQSVHESFVQDAEFPDEVVYPSSERQIDEFWVVSESGEVMASSNSDAVIDAGLWALTDDEIGGSIMANYELDGSPVTVVGTRSAGGSYWTIVAITPAYAFTTVIWLIFAVLALSLMSVTAVIAVRFLGYSFDKSSGDSENRSDINVDLQFASGDGAASRDFGVPIPSLSKLHEAVLQVTEDFVLVLDAERNVVYSSLVGIERTSKDSNIEGIEGFADHHLDDAGRARFQKWLADDASASTLTMDVFGEDGYSIPTRWEARSVDMKSGASFEVFVGRRLQVEEFPSTPV